MIVHKQGYPLLRTGIIVLTIIALAVAYAFPHHLSTTIVFSVIILILLAYLYRNPNREVETLSNRTLLSPCDGKIISIEDQHEHEYLHADCQHITIAISALDVNSIRNPLSARIKHAQRTNQQGVEKLSILYDTGYNKVLMVITPASTHHKLAYFSSPEDKVEQGKEIAYLFLKGSIDLYLPLHARILPQEGERVRAAGTTISVVSHYVT